MPSRVAAQAITIHDLDFLEHPERTSGEIRRDYPALVHRHARQADLVVVSSHTTATEVIDRLHVAPERVVICPAGAPSWTRRDPRFGGRYFLFIGTMEPRKNVGTLLDAYTALLERLPGAPPLHLAGRTTSSAAALLRRLARPPLEGRAIHRGYVPAARKRELYSGAVATVIPSLTEGFGLNALEAMTLGVPVIASRRGSLPEVLGDAALFIDPDRPGTIAEAMWKLATDEAAARQLADAGVARAAMFSWSRSAETLRQAYEEAWLRKRGRG
jgi:alpha-1,3-rhamnosyl/mannosyltransferase